MRHGSSALFYISEIQSHTIQRTAPFSVLQLQGRPSKSTQSSIILSKLTTETWKCLPRIYLSASLVKAENRLWCFYYCMSFWTSILCDHAVDILFLHTVFISVYIYPNITKVLYENIAVDENGIISHIIFFIASNGQVPMYQYWQNLDHDENGYYCALFSWNLRFPVAEWVYPLPGATLYTVLTYCISSIVPPWWRFHQFHFYTFHATYTVCASILPLCMSVYIPSYGSTAIITTWKWAPYLSFQVITSQRAVSYQRHVYTFHTTEIEDFTAAL